MRGEREKAEARRPKESTKASGRSSFFVVDCGK
jgi:hypothetical protein